MRLMWREVASPIPGIGPAAVNRLVDAVAPRRALAVVRLAGADPDEVGVALRHRDVADRHQSLALELRLERRAVVDRLPHPAVRGADVEDGRVRFVHGQVGDAAGHRGRTDRTEMQRVERPARRGRRRRLLGASDERLAGHRQHECHTKPDERNCFIRTASERQNVEFRSQNESPVALLTSIL